MYARRANLGDVAAVGALVRAALPHAPSSLQGRDDLATDDLDIGHEVVADALAAGDLAWVLETGDQIAGVAVARRRALVRASHVADVILLIHPIARGRGCGQTLLTALVDAATHDRDIHKLAMRIACDDDASLNLLASATPPWSLDRVEAGALGRGALIIDIELWGLVVGESI